MNNKKIQAASIATIGLIFLLAIGFSLTDGIFGLTAISISLCVGFCIFLSVGVYRGALEEIEEGKNQSKKFERKERQDQALEKFLRSLGLDI